MEAVKKGSFHGKYGPKLERQHAHNKIDYDVSGSIGRNNRARRGYTGVDGSDEIQTPRHAFADWSGEEISVHGSDDIELMNSMYLSAGLEPENVGITIADWEAANKLTPLVSPVSVNKNCPMEAGLENSTVRPGFDFSSLHRTALHSPPSTSRPPSASPPSVSPREATLCVDGSAGESIRGHTRTEGDSLRISLRNGSLHFSPLSEVAPRPANSYGSPRRQTMPIESAQTGRHAAAQAQKNEDDAVSVSCFIYLHGGDEITRSGSMPAQSVSSRDFGRPSHVPPDNSLIRFRSGPITGSEGETTLLGNEDISLRGFDGRVASVSTAKGDVGNISIDQSTAQSGRAVPRTVIDGSSVQEKRHQAEADTSEKKASSGSFLSFGLKPPPPMNVLRSTQADFSTYDMLDSLAPDRCTSAQSSRESEENELSLQDGFPETENSIIVSKSATPTYEESNDGTSCLGGDALPQPRKSLTLEVPEVELELDHLAAVVGQSPDSESMRVNLPSDAPAGPNYPWTKGDLLGAGSFGTVYEAVDSDGMFFAVKEVSLVESDKQAQQSISQLMQEVNMLSSFKHDNIVQYLGTDRADGKLYIFLEFVARGSLASICKRIKLTESQISAYTRQILKGLKYLHDQYIVHRDIKCANILVDTKGICKLADFGMAKQISSIDQGKSFKGSAYWMAPEVINPKQTSGKSADIWSLGCSVLEMFTGSPPFGDMEWYRVLFTVGQGNAPPIPDDLSDRAKDFLKYCLEINPTKRLTATELLDHPFVRQSVAMTPSSSHSTSVTKGLKSISEENSRDFSSASLRASESA